MTWVYGYGSLMWRPGFAPRRREVALLRGYHRQYCALSTKGRGTPETPGMMLGVLPGGSCTAIAYELEPRREARALAYLDKREGEGRANRRVMLPVELVEAAWRPVVPAWTYLPIVSNENYLGAAAREVCVANIGRGVGKRGRALDYLRAVMAEVARMETEEPALAALLDEVEARFEPAEPDRRAPAGRLAQGQSGAGK